MIASPSPAHGRTTDSPEAGRTEARGGRSREPGFARRGRYLALLAVLLGLVLAVSFAAQWWLYRSVRSQMDALMGDRLLAFGTAVAATVGWDGVLELSVAGAQGLHYEETREKLRAIARENDLDALTVVDPQRRVLVVVGREVEVGTVDLSLELETTLTEVLASGKPRSSPLARVDVGGLDDEYLKAGYAPVLDPDGTVVGAVVVEGGRRFFAILPELRARLVFNVLLGSLATLALGVVFFLTLRALIRLEDSLRGTAALAAIGQIASVVAHEIKNPLAIIRSRSERVRAKIAAGKDPAEVLEWFEVIPQEVDRLSEIVTNYLSLARPERAGEGRCRIGTIAGEIADLLGHDLERRGINLSVEADSDLAAAIGARPLKQVLLNLVLNAAEAIPAGQAGAITIQARARSARLVEVRVADDGRGMSARERSHILEPFFTTKPTGSGLGLTLVQSLVQGAGGRLEIESRPGTGTVVVVQLPLAAPPTGQVDEGDLP